jgi:hypothetical protein
MPRDAGASVQDATIGPPVADAAAPIPCLSVAFVPDASPTGKGDGGTDGGKK